MTVQGCPTYPIVLWLEIFFNTTTYPIGLSLMKPYLPIALPLPVNNDHVVDESKPCVFRCSVYRWFACPFRGSRIVGIGSSGWRQGHSGSVPGSASWPGGLASLWTCSWSWVRIRRPRKDDPSTGLELTPSTLTPKQVLEPVCLSVASLET